MSSSPRIGDDVAGEGKSPDVKMDGTLMELVEDCGKPTVQTVKDISPVRRKIEELEKLGFLKAVENLKQKVSKEEKLRKLGVYPYVRITEEKILDYLMRKAKEYNTKVGQPDFKVDKGINQPGMFLSPTHSLLASTCHRGSYSGIGYFLWEETPITTYEGIPPDGVLTTLKEHKERGVFDEFVVATVEAIPDPLLLGKINEVSDRFYIAQWGNDIALDDII